MIDPLWWGLLADTFVNLATGWFGAVFVVPIVSDRPPRVKVSILALNTIFGTVSLIVAFNLRQLAVL